MGIKQYKPTTPARRGMTSQDFDQITTKKPLKSLLASKKQQAGKNNSGRITVRHRGGGVKRHIRIISHVLPAGAYTIREIEYDPNRSARIARVESEKGVFHYIIATSEARQGAKIVVKEDAPIESGNRLTLEAIPVGTTIHAIELAPGRGGQLVRAAGTGAQLMAKEGGYAIVRMPSSEVRKILLTATASVGNVGNAGHQNIKIGSAGRNRRKGIRPGVRGVVMNATDHPHGGGDGGRHGTGKPPQTPWGQLALGYRTRSRKSTNKMIIRSRHGNKRK